MKDKIWTSLRRVTSSGRYIPEIDALRFVAISSVLFYHIAMMSEINCAICLVPATHPGVTTVLHMDRGVLLFFAVSGLILGLPFANQYIAGGKRVRLKDYLLRRVTRLEPPYIVNLLLRFPLVLWVKHVSAWAELPHLLASLVYLHWLVYGYYPTVHPPSWSLEVEVQFYLLAPLIAAVCLRHKAMSRRVLLLILIAGFSAVRAHTPETQTRFALSLACFAQYFLLGLLMADGFITVLPKLKESWLWDLAAVPLWVITFVVRDTVADYILPAILLVTFTAAFKGVLFRRFWRNPFVTTVGGMCYSLYLTHSLVLQACYMALRMLHLPNGYYFSYMWGVIIALPLILLVGGTFYVLIERPCMNKEWPRHLLLSLRQRTGIGVAS